MLYWCGGGILLFTILANLHAIELNQLCNSSECIIKDSQSEVTNSGYFTINGDKAIDINTPIGNFINYGNLDVRNNNNETFRFSTDNKSYGHITHLINYGTIKASFWIANNSGGISTLTNYGYIGGGIHQGIPHTMILNNLGTIAGQYRNVNLGTEKNGKILIANYALMLNETAMNFNAFTNNGSGDKNSHLVISGSGVTFKDGDSKIILGFGEKFQEGEGYLISKLAVDTSGTTYNDLGLDFSRLIPQNDIYTLYKQGDYFIARLQPQHSTISNISKSNIHTMNNFYTLSNSMIFPRKVYNSQNLGKKNQNNLVILRERSDRRVSKSNIIDSSPKAQNDNIVLDSAISLKSYETFAYRNESINRRIQRQNKRNYSRTKRNNNSVILSDSEESQKKNSRDTSPKAQNDNVRKSQNLKENQRNSQNLSQNLNYSQTPHNYYFILTPFFNHNSFAKSGNYNLNGFDYGFLTAFSTQVAESNSLGAHFIFSYGSLGDSKDKDLSIKSLNLNLGINYKLDLIYDMYLKARGNFYYFSNALDSLTIKNIKPNNLGFGASVIFGKDFNFGKGGILGIEAGIDYKALKTNEVSLNSQSYKQSLYNLIYADVGVNYNKYFGGFGLNLGTGFKANLAPKLAESILISNSQNLRFTLDNDKYLAYANAGISYLMQAKNFDMEFNLAYYGNFGDRVISNGGGVEWRVVW